MPNPLKRVAEVDTFDFGKAITLVISRAKELSKTVNGLVDKIEYLESRKKQEEQSLERIIDEKKQVLKLKQELTDKIVEKKTELMEFVGSKQRELENRESTVAKREEDFVKTNEMTAIAINTKQNELDLQITDLNKQKDDYKEVIKQEMRQDIKIIEEKKGEIATTEAELSIHRSKVEEANRKLAEDQNNLKDTQDLLNSRLDKITQKEHELTARDNNLKDMEQKVADARKGVTQTVADLESQLVLIKRERNKNKTDKEIIEDMKLTLSKRSKELDNREIHISDREATALTH